MKPVSFKGQTEVYRNLPGHEPLPVAVSERPAGWVKSCWKLSFRERLRLFFTSRVYITQLTYHYGTNAIVPSVEKQQPNCKNCGSPMELHKKPANKCPYNTDHITKSKYYSDSYKPGSYQNCEVKDMEHTPVSASNGDVFKNSKNDISPASVFKSLLPIWPPNF